MIIYHGQIHFRHTGKDCHQNDHAPLSGIFNRLPHRNIVSGTIVDYIRFIRAKFFNQRFTEIFFSRIDARVNTAFRRLFKPQIADIRNHDLRRSHSFCHLCDEVANRPGADYCNIQSGNIAHLFHPMYRNCKRLNHRSFFISHIRRDRGDF